jgi:hypothetical protein
MQHFTSNIPPTTMTITLKTKIHFLFIGFLAVFTSCKKELPTCKGNCSEVIFSGLIYDKTSNQPLGNRDIKIDLSPNGYCIGCVHYKIASGKSSNSGSFSFSKVFDTTLLTKNHIGVNVSVPNNYIQNAEPVGPGLTPDNNSWSSVSFYNMNLVAMRNLSFGFYPKTLLRINLHRTTQVTSQNNHLGLEFEFDGKSSIWGLMLRPTNKDTTLTINTTANIFTKIKTFLELSPTNYNRTLDSIKCRLNTNNSIDVVY